MSLQGELEPFKDEALDAELEKQASYKNKNKHSKEKTLWTI